MPWEYEQSRSDALTSRIYGTAFKILVVSAPFAVVGVMGFIMNLGWRAAQALLH